MQCLGVVLCCQSHLVSLLMVTFHTWPLVFELISINQATTVLPCTMDCNLFGLLFSLCVHLFVFMFHYHFPGPMPPPAPPTSGDNSADTATQPWQQGVLTSRLITIISILYLQCLLLEQVCYHHRLDFLCQIW